MGNLLSRIFVKDYENTGDPVVRERYGKFAGVVGIISNILLCTAKILAGLFSGMQRSVRVIWVWTPS